MFPSRRSSRAETSDYYRLRLSKHVALVQGNRRRFYYRDIIMRDLFRIRNNMFRKVSVGGIVITPIAGIMSYLSYGTAPGPKRD